MKISKKQMIIAAIVIGAIAVWYFFIRKKKIESSYGPNFGSYGFYGNESNFASIGQICSKDRPCGNGLRCSGRRCVSTGAIVPATSGAPAADAIRRAETLSPSALIAAGGGPIQISPASTTA